MATILIPTDFVTLQDAVDAALSGDTILIEEGSSYPGGDIITITADGLTISGPALPAGVVISLAAGVSSVTIGGEFNAVIHDNGADNVITANVHDPLGNPAGLTTVEVTGGDDLVTGGGEQTKLIVDYAALDSWVEGHIGINWLANANGGHSGVFQGAAGARLVSFSNVGQFEVHSTSFNDYIVFENGSGAQAAVYAGEGDDTIYGAAVIYGGAGNDWITGGYGEEGDDTFVVDAATPAPAVIDGGSGFNTLRVNGSGDIDFRNSSFAGIQSINFFESGSQGTGNLTLQFTGEQIAALLGNSGGHLDIRTPFYPSVKATMAISMNGLDTLDIRGFDVFATNTSTGGVFTTAISGNDTLDDVITGSRVQDLIEGAGGADDIQGLAGDDILKGGLGDDLLYGGTGSDAIHGDGGDDYIDGGEGSDTIFGGDGFDTITGWSGDDTIDGGKGQDMILGSDGNDTISGGEGADTITGEFGNDTISGGGGNDVLEGEEGIDTIMGDDGDDAIFGEIGDRIDGGFGADSIHLNGAASTGTPASLPVVLGGAGNDVIILESEWSATGSGWRLAIHGDGGEFVNGEQLTDGDDTIDVSAAEGGAFNAQLGARVFALFGEGGNDIITGSAGVDVILGGTGINTIAAGAGDDEISSFGGIDAIDGGDGLDTWITSRSGSTDESLDFSGSSAIVTLTDGTTVTGIERFQFTSGSGDDYIVASEGPSSVVFVSGDSGVPGHYEFHENLNSLFSGGGGNDELVGGTTEITLYGGSGDDTLRGGASWDFLSGDGGDDIITTGGNPGDKGFVQGQTYDEAHGRQGNDILVGGAGVDWLFGEAGSDRMTGGAGDDHIFDSSFGADVNTAVYSGTRADYDIVALSPIGGEAVFRITHVRNVGVFDDGSDIVQGVGQFAFSDGVVLSANLLQVNHAPTASPVTLAAIAEDSGDRIIAAAELLAGATDSDGQTLSISTLALTSGNGTLTSNGNGIWTYVPAADDDSAASFTYTVSDGQLTATSTATLDITPVNDAAIVSSADVIRAETNSALNISGVLTSDDIDNPDNRFTPDSKVGALGAFIIDADGNWSFEASSAFNELNTGNAPLTETFGVTSVDGTASHVTITITGTNDAAVIGGTTLNSITEDAAVNSVVGQLSVSDVDSPAAFQSVSTATASDMGYGSFTVTSTGLWTFVLNNGSPAVNALNTGQSLTDTFSILTADGTAQVVTVTIAGTTDPVTNKVINGTNSSNLLLGSAAAETFYGYGGDDVIAAFGGNDTVYAGSGNDAVAGGGGSDVLFGEAGADSLFGEAGADRVNGGTGADDLFGGTGRDVFHFTFGDSGLTARSADLIGDFEKGPSGAGDVIDFSASLSIGGSSAAATVEQASINQATGVASFTVGSGISLADAVSDIASRFTAASDAAGEFAFFRVNNSGAVHLFISDGIAGATSGDVLVILSGITSVGSVDLTAGDLGILM